MVRGPTFSDSLKVDTKRPKLAHKSWMSFYLQRQKTLNMNHFFANA